MRKGVQKRKETSEPGPESSATGGQAVLPTNKWEGVFTHSGDGAYSMQQWKPCYKFRHAYGNLSYEDPQPFMRMSMAIGATEGIVSALTALLADQQACKKTRRGTAFGADKEDKAPRQLRIYFGWPDWYAEEYDFEYEAFKDHRMPEALWRQKQLGELLGSCEQLESLHLENMEFYSARPQAQLQAFFGNLHACAQLKRLAVVNNANGGENLKDIIPEARKLPLRELDLSGNRLHRETWYPEEAEERARETAFVELLGTLGQCKTLETLSLADMRLRFKTADDESTRCVLRLMQELHLLTALTLTNNMIHEEAKAAIEAAAPARIVVEF